MMMRRKIALGVAALFLLAGMAACSRKPDTADVEPEEFTEMPTASEQQMSLRSTVLYYQDDMGYLVPVMRKIPWEEGVAKSALSYLVSSEQNDQDAARMGLFTTIPAGTSIDLDVTDSLATVSLGKEALSCEDAAAENAMVMAVTSTLLEFPTVEKVQIVVDGEKVQALKHGTDISKAISGQDINLEGIAKGVSADGSQRVRLYFESDVSEAMVPVTRTVFSNADVETAVVELLKGPAKDSGLSAPMPPNAALISVSRKNGVVSINFTKDFLSVVSNSDGGKTAMRSLVLTCQQFPDVKEVKVLVDGETFDLGAETLSTQYVNTESDIINGLVETNADVLPD